MYSSLSTALVATDVVLSIFASIFVGLRFKARSLTKAGLGTDDFVILGALLIQYAAAAMSIYGAVKGGTGDSEQNLFRHPSEVAANAKILFAGPLIFATAIALIKLSTLLLFKRIFVTRGFRLACYIMMAVTAGWFLASVFPQIFQTNPVSNSWTEPKKNATINYSVYLLSLAAINTVMDLIIVCMPLFVIRTLQMSPRRKLLVSGMFLLGLFCIIASVVRLYYLVVLKDTPSGPHSRLTSVAAQDTIWGFIEPQMSIVAACLPTLAPLFRGGRDPASIIQSVLSVLSLRSASSKTSGNGSKSSKAGIEQENRDARNAWVQLNSDTTHSNVITYERGVELDSIQNAQRPSNGIAVQQVLRTDVETV